LNYKTATDAVLKILILRALEMATEFYTYGHYTEDGRLFYIGKGVGRRAQLKTNRNKHWHHTVAKYGLKVQIFAKWATEKEALDHECLLIAYYKNEVGIKLVNCTDGGEGSSGFVMSAEQKAKLSASSKLKWQDPEYQAKMKLRAKGGFSEKKRISSLVNAKKGRAQLATLEGKEAASKKNSEKSQAMWDNEAFKQQMSETHKASCTKERRIKMGLIAKGRIRMTDGVNERNVLPAEVGALIQSGWVQGRGLNSPSMRSKDYIKTRSN
jgi:hypothetical protein